MGPDHLYCAHRNAELADEALTWHVQTAQGGEKTVRLPQTRNISATGHPFSCFIALHAASDESGHHAEQRTPEREHAVVNRETAVT